MSEIFRFVAVRPPQLDLPRFTLTLAFDSSPFIVTLLNARSADDPRTAMIQAAVDFQATTAFVVHPEQLVFFPVLTQLYQSVSGAEQLSLDDLDLRTRDAFGADAVTVRSNPDFPAHQRMLSDSIIAWKIASGNDPSLLDSSQGVLPSIAAR
jgi:hypothetical protein